MLAALAAAAAAAMIEIPQQFINYLDVCSYECHVDFDLRVLSPIIILLAQVLQYVYKQRMDARSSITSIFGNVL